jgi:ferrous iron transport protein B
VGKSTVFNALTGMKQHTGNWSGKTVDVAEGRYVYENEKYVIYDLPGCYSLYGGSGEEAVARNFILTSAPDATVAVCDATCLERTLILALETVELGVPTVICINLMDEAKRKGITVDVGALSEQTGVPCIGITARKKQGLSELKTATRTASSHRTCPSCQHSSKCPYQTKDTVNLRKTTSTPDHFITKAESIARSCVTRTPMTDRKKHVDERIDRVLMGKSGIPIGILLLGLILWITVVGANYPSELLRQLLFSAEEPLAALAHRTGIPQILADALISGAYRTLAWVVSVMLPPMAIFFPLFTLLEDLGYLPRAAFLLDTPLKRCGSCGKQALTMCMGLGCSAVGVSGCRIIHSERERHIAILTNAFMPCNGRFPTVILLATLFSVPFGMASGAVSAFALIAALSLGVFLSFTASKLLSLTVLRGEPSAFVLELPPIRPPDVGSIIIRSVLDRTVFVLGRAVAVAAPAGIVIWAFSNITVGNADLLSTVSGVLDPFARLMGLDGIILLAFILGFPANEIVLPIAIMAYSGAEAVTELSGESLYALLTSNGWTVETAVCASLFCLCHFPCSTTLLTVKKETGSWRYTALAAVIPTVFGIILCMTAHLIFTLISL